MPADHGEIVIAEYAANHREDIIDLILDIQVNEFAVAIRREDQPDLADIPGFYQTGCGNFWVALSGGSVVGTISLRDIGGRRAALRKFFVHPAFRGGAVAGLLLATLLEWARRHSLREIYLGTTAKFLAAHRFYDKNGFARVAREDLPAAFPVMQVDSIFFKYTL